MSIGHPPAPAAGDGNSVSQTLTIANQRGLHARAAAKFVKLAGSFSSEVEVNRGDTTVSGMSIMGLMMLAAGIGSTIHVSARGTDAAEAVAALADLVNRKFDEE